MMRSYKCFLHVSEMATLTYNWGVSIAIKNCLILNFIHNIFNRRDTEMILPKDSLQVENPQII
jgi:hypothetical protein